MADPLKMVQEIADATASVAKEITQHEALKNSPEMQTALVIHRIQEILDEGRKEIAEKHLDDIRLLLATPNAGG